MELKKLLWRLVNNKITASCQNRKRSLEKCYANKFQKLQFQSFLSFQRLSIRNLFSIFCAINILFFCFKKLFSFLLQIGGSSQYLNFDKLHNAVALAHIGLFQGFNLQGVFPYPSYGSHFPPGARVSSQTGYYYETNANLTEPRWSLINNLEISNDRREKVLCLARAFTESRFLARGPVIRTSVKRLVNKGFTHPSKLYASKPSQHRSQVRIRLNQIMTNGSPILICVETSSYSLDYYFKGPIRTIVNQREKHAHIIFEMLHHYGPCKKAITSLTMVSQQKVVRHTYTFSSAHYR